MQCTCPTACPKLEWQPAPPKQLFLTAFQWETCLFHYCPVLISSVCKEFIYRLDGFLVLSYNLCTALPCVCESLIIAEAAGWRGNKHCLPRDSPGSAACAVGSELAEPNAVSWWVLYPSTEQVHQKCRAQCTEASGGCSVHCMMAIFTLTTTRSEHSTTGSLPVHTSDCAGSLVNYTSAVHV